MSKKITQEELESYLWGSAVLLRNHIDAGSYKQYIFPLLFFKRLNDVYEEETENAVRENGPEAADWEEIHSYVIPVGAHWNDVRNATQDVGKAILNAFRAIENANRDKLQGIFGDGTWTNKNRLPDRLLKDIIEHFSTRTLSIANCPEDELGQGYEYLIKQFADDSGHTAQEFYTNRTVVHLMTEMLKPQSGESIYDPTCGSAGMLISSVAYLKEMQREWRNVSLYGQEINALTAAIGRMNLFLHGVDDFKISNGDTLTAPSFIERGRLKQFDLVLANPPYSISEWNREAFAADKYGRNFLGVPSQGIADFAFLQHILKSMKPVTGRCAVLLPRGILSRYAEIEMRKKLIEADLVECVVAVGKGLFYNSPMEACVLIARTEKPFNRRGRVLLINASDLVDKVGNQSFLSPDDIEKISKTYEEFSAEEGFSYIATKDEILENEGSLSISLYVPVALEGTSEHDETPSQEYFDKWEIESKRHHKMTDKLISMLGEKQ